jgi:hypothetical protein
MGQVASSKVVKHWKTCFDNQHVSYHLRLTFLLPALEALDFLQRVQSIMHSNIVFHRSKDAIFKRI